MKLTLEILNNDEVIQTREYKTLKAIQNDYPDIEYHQLRAVYLYHSGKEQKKFLHPRTTELIKTLRIKPKQISLVATVGA
jgi:hypothetical protein